MKSLLRPPHPKPLLPQTTNPLQQLNGWRGGRLLTQQGEPLPTVYLRFATSTGVDFRENDSDNYRDRAHYAPQGCLAEPNRANGCFKGDGGVGDGATAALPPHTTRFGILPATKIPSQILSDAAVCSEEEESWHLRQINFKEAGGRELAALFAGREAAAGALPCRGWRGDAARRLRPSPPAPRAFSSFSPRKANPSRPKEASGTARSPRAFEECAQAREMPW